jgi:hypothetical protein
VQQSIAHEERGWRVDYITFRLCFNIMANLGICQLVEICIVSLERKILTHGQKDELCVM